MPTLTTEDAESLAARIKADERQAQIQKLADQISTLLVIDRPTFFVALEALKHATMNMTVTMLLMDGITDEAITRRVELAVTEAQDLYRLQAALARDIYTRSPKVALDELRANMTTLNHALPSSTETPDVQH